MEYNPFRQVPAIYILIAIAFLLILFNWMGYHFKHWQFKKNPVIRDSGLGPAEGSLLGLSAFLLSFTFSISESKFDNRRHAIVQDANDIGTAISVCNLYPDSIRNLLRTDLKNYLETRIEYFAAGDDPILVQKSIQKADSISRQCWNKVVSFSNQPNSFVVTSQMVPELKSLDDNITLREASRTLVVQPIILVVLIVLSLASAFIAGYGSKINERNSVLVITFSLMTTLTLYLVMELNRPTEGFINLNSAEQMIVDLRNIFTENK